MWQNCMISFSGCYFDARGGHGRRRERGWRADEEDSLHREETTRTSKAFEQLWLIVLYVQYEFGIVIYYVMS